MEPVCNLISIKTLDLILEKFNNEKVTRTDTKKFNITKIISVNIRNCGYATSNKKVEIKTHLHVKFTSPDEI